MQNTFFGCIPMRFFWQKYHSYRCTKIFQCLEIPFCLQSKCSRIIISFTVNQQHWRFHLVSIHKWRHGVVNFRYIPIISLLRLESKRRKCSVISPASGNSTSIIFRMRQQVCSHKCAVRMSANCNFGSVDIA